MAKTLPEHQARESFTRGFQWAGYSLGFGIGGFFDGILLHQVLQWHHLLSGLSGEAFRDIRVQILADGLFHVLMYMVAAVGLCLLWRTRQEYAAPGADRRLLANALIGFGVWHVLDSFLSHWVLGLHRIRMDVDNPLFWDLLWFVAFGLVFLALGYWLRRPRPPHSPPPPSGIADRRGKIVAPLTVALAAVLGGSVAALPPPGVTSTLVLFTPGTSPETVFAAFDAIDARLIWADPSGQVWALDMSSGGDPSRLYRHGALLVSNSLLPVGCFNWTGV